MKLTFVDAPPERPRGRGLDDTTLEFIEALKTAPGKWAQHPVVKSSPSKATIAALDKRGCDASWIPTGVKGKYGLWASYRKPDNTASTPAAAPEGPAPMVDLTGKVLACTSCDWKTKADKPADLRAHTLARHQRPPAKIERTPISPDGSDDDTTGDEPDVGDE